MHKIILLILVFSNNVFAANMCEKMIAPKILARSNVKDSYNLPPLSFIANAAPSINNNGEIAFKVIATGEEGLQGIWVKTNEDQNGKILFTAPEDLVVTDPVINNHQKVVFSLFDDMHSEGVFVLDANEVKVNQVIDPKKYKLDFYTYPAINDKNEIYFRGTNKLNDRSIYHFAKEMDSIIDEGDDVNGATPSYLFRPAINQKGQVAFKMRMGKKGAWDDSNPDQIALFTPSNDPNVSPTITSIAVDFDADKTSSYKSFLNSVGISNEGHVSFVSLTDDGRLQLNLYYPDKIIKKIAIENEGDILNIEMFSSKVNKQGHILFRGKDKRGKRSLFFYNGFEVVKLISVGDDIDSDLGPAKILDNEYYPGISGEVDINDNDQIVFCALIQSAKDNREWGQGIYLIDSKK